MSSIYGLFAGNHSSSISLIKDGEIIMCLEEERIKRVKAGDDPDNFPDNAVQKIQDVTGLNIVDSEHIILAEPVPDKWSRELFGDRYEKVSHHTAHNYGAYFTSGLEGKVLAVSYDGGGESSVMKVFLCEDGKMTQIKSLPYSINASLSHIWGFSTTSIMGDGKWKMMKDEGKLMGMAPEGHYDERIYKILKSLINYKDYKFYPSGTPTKTKFITDSMYFSGEFATQKQREVFSYNLQKLTEDIMLEFFNDLNRDYPEYTKLVLSGGLFANVKLNQKINELGWVDEIFVYPPMGDEGLSLGAAIYKAVQLGEITKPLKLNKFSLGTDYSEDYINKLILNFNFKRSEYNEDVIVNDLIDGKIIGWFDGKMEYGPRALGNRSILTRPTRKETHSELNGRLGRYDTMPFAPMVLDEAFDEVFTCGKSKHAAQFMTICYTTKDEWVDVIPAVIQKSDKTARPQIITEENNPRIHRLMKRYYEESKIPVILNTSFNIHNEPIIEHPKHALTHLTNKVVDKLVLGNYVYENR